MAFAVSSGVQVSQSHDRSPFLLFPPEPRTALSAAYGRSGMLVLSTSRAVPVAAMLRRVVNESSLEIACMQVHSRNIARKRLAVRRGLTAERAGEEPRAGKREHSLLARGFDISLDIEDCGCHGA